MPGENYHSPGGAGGDNGIIIPRTRLTGDFITEYSGGLVDDGSIGTPTYNSSTGLFEIERDGTEINQIGVRNTKVFWWMPIASSGGWLPDLDWQKNAVKIWLIPVDIGVDGESDGLFFAICTNNTGGASTDGTGVGWNNPGLSEAVWIPRTTLIQGSTSVDLAGGGSSDRGQVYSEMRFAGDGYSYVDVEAADGGAPAADTDFSGATSFYGGVTALTGGAQRYAWVGAHVQTLGGETVGAKVSMYLEYEVVRIGSRV